MIKTLVRALRQAGLRPRVAEPCLRLRRLAVAAAPPVSLPAPPATGERAGLRALTAAALALPGLAQAPAATAAPGDAASFEYGYYKQTPWKLLGGLKSQYSPLQVDNIEANGMITLEDRWKFGFNYAQDTWSGATPVASAPYALGGNNPTPAGASPLIRGNGSILYDRNLSPYALDEETATYVPDNRLVQTVASASVEVRNQGDFRLGYEWDEAAVNVGGGVSQEPDYNSAFGSLNGRMDFNQKLTSANLGLSYTNSDIYALINPLYAPYVNTSYYASRGQIQTETDANGGVTQHLTGNRQDWATHLSVAQVMNKDLLLESGIGFTRSTGFLANPYKAVDMLYVDTNSAPFIGPDFGLPDLWAPVVEGVIRASGTSAWCSTSTRWMPRCTAATASSSTAGVSRRIPLMSTGCSRSANGRSRRVSAITRRTPHPSTSPISCSPAPRRPPPRDSSIWPACRWTPIPAITGCPPTAPSVPA